MNKSFSFHIESDERSNYSFDINSLKNITEDEASDMVEKMIEDQKILLYTSVFGDVAINDSTIQIDFESYEGEDDTFEDAIVESVEYPLEEVMG